MEEQNINSDTKLKVLEDENEKLKAALKEVRNFQIFNFFQVN